MEGEPRVPVEDRLRSGDGVVVPTVIACARFDAVECRGERAAVVVEADVSATEVDQHAEAKPVVGVQVATVDLLEPRTDTIALPSCQRIPQLIWREEKPHSNR